MKIHHIGYLVSCINDTKGKFMSLGYTPEKGMEYDCSRDIFIQFMINGTYRIELVQPASEVSPYNSAMKRFKNLPYHICYETPDVDMEIETLIKSGFKLTQAPQEAPCINNHRVAFLQSPDMGIIELLEMED